MRFSSTRSSSRLAVSSASLVAFLLLSAGADANRSTQCIRSQSRELASLAACGHRGSLEYCMGKLPSAADGSTSTVLALEECFVNAGCTAAEAQIEASWTLKRCESPEDLRRRAKGDDDDDDDDDDDGDDGKATSKPTAKATDKTKEKTTEKSTEKAAATSAIITSDAASTTLGLQPTTAGPSTVFVTASSTSSTTTSAQAQTTGRPSQCFTTSLVRITVCPTQSTGTGSGSRLSCFPSSAARSACAPGLICHTDPQGIDSCMYAHNSLDAGGVAVALLLSLSAAAAVFLMLLFCCRERAEQRRHAKAAEAEAIAREAKLAAIKAGGNVRVGVTPVGGQGGADAVSSRSVSSSGDLPPLPVPNPGNGFEGGMQNPFADGQQQGR